MIWETRATLYLVIGGAHPASSGPNTALPACKIMLFSTSIFQ